MIADTDAPEPATPARSGGEGTPPAVPAEPPAATAAAGLPSAWQVHLPVFDGPLDLLLHLIRVNKVEITDIPVALICDQFHAYLQLMEELDLDVAGDFIFEAAQLIQIKSKLLLPRPPAAPGEPEPEDPRQELVQRLLEYRRLKDAAQALAEVDRVRQGIWTRRARPWRPEPAEDEEVDLGDVSLFDLMSAFRGVLVRYQREHPDPVRLRGETFPVRAQFERLLRGMEDGRPLDFLDDLRHRSCRAEAVSAFLAVLELARLQLVRIHQTEAGEILLYRTEREIREEEWEAISQ